MQTKHYTIPVFIPQASCPFQCIFCNQKKLSGTRKVPTCKEAAAIIDKYFSTIDYKKNYVEIGFFGGNFTGLSLSAQEMFLKTAYDYIKAGKVKSIRLSTRPDYVNERVLKLLKKYKVRTIELGVQSMDSKVLQLSSRGHSAEEVVRAAEMIKQEGFVLGLQMMLGLPGDSLRKAKFTARKIVELGAENTRIYPALVIKGTFLEELYQKRKYTPFHLAEAVLWCKELVKIFEKGGVKIIRMGLHPAEGLLSRKDLSAGPFHPAFGQLVLTKLWAERLKPVLNNHADNTKLEIQVPPPEVNYAAGYQGQNKKMLLKKFSKVSFKKDSTLKGREFVVKELISCLEN